MDYAILYAYEFLAYCCFCSSFSPLHKLGAETENNKLNEHGKAPLL